MIISPSILSADFVNLERDIKKVECAGAEWLHIDVMDGAFVPNITIGIPVVKSIRGVTDLVLDVHLMIEHPEKYIEDFANAGADIITVHYEATGVNTLDVINEIKSLGKKAGLSIKPNTRPEEIKEYIEFCDLILVMTVEPGFGGQKFMRDCAEKLPYIKALQNEKQYLQVDGGINAETGVVCKDFGANSLVAGNYIFNSENIKERIDSLR
ncbi:ribulose-phosphate 3-epimerase [bacterium]|nr:ribulose-phosphate 3-epimerase [bacterium]